MGPRHQAGGPESDLIDGREARAADIAQRQRICRAPRDPALKDNENVIAFKFLERLHEALHVDGAKLMERNETDLARARRSRSSAR
jgi:hypothetical protein